MLYDFLKWRVGAPIVRHVLRPQVVGLDLIPTESAALIVGNHISAGDTYPVAILTRRRIFFPGKRALFTAKNPKGRLLAALLKFAGHVPIDPQGGTSSHSSLHKLVELLQQGELVGIFPEGTRSPDGRMYRFHTGVARMALAAGVPVIPMACVNTYLRRGFLGLPTLRDAQFTLGEPLDFSDWHGRDDDPAALRWVADEIAAVLCSMTGQEYVEVYASRVKSGELTIEQANAMVRDRPGAGNERPPTNAEIDGAGDVNERPPTNAEIDGAGDVNERPLTNAELAQ